MNGRAARRIRRAAWQVVLSTGTNETTKQVRKRLKREYNVRPFHRRKFWAGVESLSHRQQEQRWWAHQHQHRNI